MAGSCIHSPLSFCELIPVLYDKPVVPITCPELRSEAPDRIGDSGARQLERGCDSDIVVGLGD